MGKVEFEKEKRPATNVPIKPPRKKKKEALNQKLLPGKLDNLADKDGQKMGSWSNTELGLK